MPLTYFLPAVYMHGKKTSDAINLSLQLVRKDFLSTVLDIYIYPICVFFLLLFVV